jgi:hypothetical protein
MAVLTSGGGGLDGVSGKSSNITTFSGSVYQAIAPTAHTTRRMRRSTVGIVRVQPSSIGLLVRDDEIVTLL